MATVPLPQRSRLRVRAKYALFAFIALMMAYVVRHNEAFLIDGTDPVWEHYQPIKWWLLPHGLAGATALFLAVSQFSTRIRTRYTVVHRTFGRIYVCLVAIVAPLGFYIQYLDQASGDPGWVTVAAGVDAFLWLFATGMAFWCIRNRWIEQHRQWMFRSFAMALIFLEVRVILGLTGWESLGPEYGGSVIWACVALAYPLADLALLIDERLQKRGAKP